MQYLMLIYEDEKVWQDTDEAGRAAIMEAYYTYTNNLQEAGVFKGWQRPAAGCDRDHGQDA